MFRRCLSYLTTEPKGPKIYFPSFTMAMLRSEKLKPNQVAFKVVPRVNKYDIKQYLEKIYGVKVNNIMVFNFLGYTKRSPRTPWRKIKTPAWKKAIVEIDEPFQFPEYESHWKYQFENFEKRLVEIEELQALKKKRDEGHALTDAEHERLGGKLQTKIVPAEK